MPMSSRLLRPRAAVSAGFDPRSLGASMWYDPSDTAQVTLNGTNVSELRDKGLLGLHLSNSTASTQIPYTIAGANSRNLLTTTASNQFLRYPGNGSNSVASYTVTSQSLFLVFSVNPTQGTNARLFAQSVVGASNDFSGTNYFNGPFCNGATAISVFANGTVQASISNPSSQLFVYSLVHTGSSFSHRVNRGTAGNGTSTLNTSFGVFGLPSSGSAIGLQGNYAEAIVFNNQALSESARTTVERYLAAKWGVTIAA